MTTFIPSLTLPAALFANPAASILFPIALGTAVGFSVRRMFAPAIPTNYTLPLPNHLQRHSSGTNSQTARETQKTYLALKQPPYRPPPYVFGPAWSKSASISTSHTQFLQMVTEQVNKSIY